MLRIGALSLLLLYCAVECSVDHDDWDRYLFGELLEKRPKVPASRPRPRKHVARAETTTHSHVQWNRLLKVVRLRHELHPQRVLSSMRSKRKALSEKKALSAHALQTPSSCVEAVLDCDGDPNSDGSMATLCTCIADSDVASSASCFPITDFLCSKDPRKDPSSENGTYCWDSIEVAGSQFEDQEDEGSLGSQLNQALSVVCPVKECMLKFLDFSEAILSVQALPVYVQDMVADTKADIDAFRGITQNFCDEGTGGSTYCLSSLFADQNSHLTNAWGDRQEAAAELQLQCNDCVRKMIMTDWTALTDFIAGEEGVSLAVELRIRTNFMHLVCKREPRTSTNGSDFCLVRMMTIFGDDKVNSEPEKCDPSNATHVRAADCDAGFSEDAMEELMETFDETISLLLDPAGQEMLNQVCSDIDNRRCFTRMMLAIPRMYDTTPNGTSPEAAEYFQHTQRVVAGLCSRRNATTTVFCVTELNDASDYMDSKGCGDFDVDHVCPAECKNYNGILQTSWDGLGCCGFTYGEILAKGPPEATDFAVLRDHAKHCNYTIPTASSGVCLPYGNWVELPLPIEMDMDYYDNNRDAINKLLLQDIGENTGYASSAFRMDQSTLHKRRGQRKGSRTLQDTITVQGQGITDAESQQLAVYVQANLASMTFPSTCQAARAAGKPCTSSSVSVVMPSPSGPVPVPIPPINEVNCSRTPTINDATAFCVGCTNTSVCQVGAVCNYTCNAGTTLHAGKTAFYCNATGTWTAVNGTTSYPECYWPGSSDSLSGSAIAAIVICSILGAYLILLICLACCFYVQKSKKKKERPAVPLASTDVIAYAPPPHSEAAYIDPLTGMPGPPPPGGDWGLVPAPAPVQPLVEVGEWQNNGVEHHTDGLDAANQDAITPGRADDIVGMQTGLACPLGHPMDPDDTFCQQCGQRAA